MAPCLPVELIEEIVSLSSKSDLPALCRTSKLFREIVEPLIYRRICIPCGDTLTDDRLDEDRAGKMLHWIVGLYNSLRDDDCKVAMVERVEVTDLIAYISIKSPILEIPGFALVNYTPGDTPKSLDMISTAIAAVLSVLPNLPVFHLSGRITLVSRGFELLPPGQVDRHLAPMSLLEHVLCPNLREVDLDIPRRGNSAPLHFIRRHSKLIVARLCVRQPGLRNSVKLCMPSLERFEAPAGSFQYFADTIPPKLSHVAVDFVYVASVARLAFPKLLERELNVIRSFPSLKLLTLIGDNNLHQIETMGAVAARIPNLEQLEIRHKSYPCLMSKPRENIESMAQAFTRFKGLRCFTYVALTNTGRTSARVDTEVDVSTVTRWGMVCPTLMYCEIYRNVWQRVQGEWVIASL